MTYRQSMQLFDIVNRNFKSEVDARLFVEEIDALISNSFKEEVYELATKQDLLNETAKINKETANIYKEIANVKADLIKEINNAKFDTIKWIFSFWVTIILLFIATFYLKK